MVAIIKTYGVYGTTTTIAEIKSLVELEYEVVLPPSNPIVTVTGEVHLALTTVLPNWNLSKIMDLIHLLSPQYYWLLLLDLEWYYLCLYSLPSD